MLARNGNVQVGTARGEGSRRRLLVMAAGTAMATAVALAAPAAAGVATTTGTLPTALLAVTSPVPGALADAAASVRALGGTVAGTYEVAGALLVTLPAGVTPAGTVRVPDTAVTFASAHESQSVAADVAGATYRTTIGAPATGGAGVTVALVDTGVADSADLAGRVTHVNVSGAAQGDGYGHGTFLAGLIAGDGTLSGGRYVGVAPQAQLLDVQVADPDGSTSLSKVLAGLQAVADRAATDPTLRVVSLSLSTGSPLPTSYDPLSRALVALWNRGLTVLVAAGNEGPKNDTVTSPGTTPQVLTVGAVDENSTSGRRDDRIADYSSRSSAGGLTKPELAAPGTSLVSLRAVGSIADTQNPQSVVDTAYFRGTGTSMSTAVAAGAVATLLAVRPALSPDEVKALLGATAYRMPGVGAGGLDLAAASTAAVPDVTTPTTPVGGPFGPAESDAAAWNAFAAAWESGDLQAVAAAWIQLSPKSRAWAANAWTAAVIAEAALNGNDATFESRAWGSRAWGSRAWGSRAWATDAWVSRAWGSRAWGSRAWADFVDFASRAWAEDDWTSRAWGASDFASRAWAEQDWLAYAWVSRAWASRAWGSTAWESRAWSSRAWGSAEWTSFALTSRAWGSRAWGSRAWASRSW